MEQGWVSIHRKLKDKGYYKKSEYIHLWVHLLLSANHEPHEFAWNGKIMDIKRGSLITGRKSLFEATGIKETTIERILELFETEHQIEQQKTNKYRLITILNWETHQNKDKRTDNKRTTNGQQTDTYNNDNKENNENKSIATAKAVATVKKPKREPKPIIPYTPEMLEERLKHMERIEGGYLDIIASYIREKPVNITNSKQLSLVIARFARIAKASEGAYTNRQIFDAIAEIKKENMEKQRKREPQIDWGVETIIKKLVKK